MAQRQKEQIDQLTAKLQEAQDQVAQAQQLTQEHAAQSQQQDAQVKQQAMQIQQLAQQLKDSQIREAQLREQVAKSEPSTETGSLQKIAGAAASANTEPERATAMLTLAMQLHDQYVDKGKAKAKEITEESQRKYEEIIGSANDYSNRTRSEADQYSTDTRATPTTTCPARPRMAMPIWHRSSRMAMRT